MILESTSKKKTQAGGNNHRAEKQNHPFSFTNVRVAKVQTEE
jgi:hypothetical protein